MRFEQTSGRFTAVRQVSPSLVIMTVAFVVIVILALVTRSVQPEPNLGWRILFIISLGILIWLTAWRSYRIEVDGATQRITVTHRRVGKTDERTVSFDEVSKILWLRVGVPWKKLHRVDLYLDADSVMLIDEQYRSLDSWSSAEVELLVRGIAKIVNVPIEERDL